MPEWVFEQNRINPGSEIISIDSVLTRQMDDREIDELLELSNRNKQVLSVSVIDENGEFKKYELPYEDRTFVDVPVEFHIDNISSLDSVNSTYKTVYNYVMEWSLFGLNDIARETFKEAVKSGGLTLDDLNNNQAFACYYDLDEFESMRLWKPSVYLDNLISQDADSYEENFASFISFYPSYIDDSGKKQAAEFGVRLLQENAGIATFKAYFNYEPFPFDRQNLVFTLKASEGVPSFGFQSGGLANSFNSLELYEWKKHSFEIQSFYSDDLWGGKDINISYQISLERNYIYFLTKIYLPIILILFLAYSTLWIKPKEIESRLTVSVVCFLALITYTFIIDRDLPKLAYLTAMDLIILYSYLFAAIPTLESIYVNKLSVSNIDQAERIDAKLRTLLPFIYIALTIFIIALNIINHPNAIEALKFTT